LKVYGSARTGQSKEKKADSDEDQGDGGEGEQRVKAKMGQRAGDSVQRVRRMLCV